MNRKKIIGINKFTFLLIFIYFIIVVGTTYAYFAFSYENTSTIVGNVINVDATLTVEKVVGTNEKLVPMMDAALPNALLGTGSNNGACIDSLGNLSCQVYKITLTNNASRLQHLVGTIELYPKEGSSNAYSNLKWQELSDTDTVKDEAIINGMNESILVSGLTMESKETKTWYIGVWLSEIESDQKNIDKGEFGGTVTFEVNEEIVEGTVGEMPAMNVFAKKYMIPVATSDESIDFSKTSTESGTNGVYIISNTLNDTYPIYYYRGNVKNNLIFANFCWKIVRTTETGGLKLIYNGTPSSGTCNNTGDATQIGESVFNESAISLAYEGYMYGSVYTSVTKKFNTDYTEYVYGSGFIYDYDTKKYTLTNTISKTWYDIYDGGLNNYHYTCFQTSAECSETNGKIYYVYFSTTSSAYYITLSDGKNVEDALSEMLDYNDTSSVIKGNETISGSLDNWYKNNIDNTKYENYVEDTVWCNDRSIYQLNGWNPNGGDTTKYLYFNTYNRLFVQYKPDLTCPRDIDEFTVGTENGNGDLDYPVGLLTGDEIMLAGGKVGTLDSLYYLYTGNSYWSNSPYQYYYESANILYTNISSGLVSAHVKNTSGIRPCISLKNGFTILDNGADGSVNKPYIVE